MGDAPRLRILELLKQGELCLTEMVAAATEKLLTVSLRLRMLRTEGLVIRRRKRNHMFMHWQIGTLPTSFKTRWRTPSSWR